MCVKAAAGQAAAFTFFPGLTGIRYPRNRNVDEQADLLQDRGHW